ncbi:tripartite tricarboxylate transporter permease [Halomonas elongata]|uniref:TTT family transporter large transmembrane protein n=1 Tax=Halomonas elongata (strain ATCC 33173 / DSM 2581 / NBRC 15536 / NCIMB 2198 / 1H9) TaxID=768066 RepID=E1V491_HALED|nr:tripartite tricarboxylate transporter permease [Halomonas elongata]WBF18170.1 tripartite tricarboxylate transporter permease [Halomonas elongata]WPU47021.1 tripartite tricarboxylate transporter permease [Halomonas elongata DSM 2581]CBV40928.1 TTT family transporter large transmembrane protein [Halomonas elongata DSM 2581]
MDAFLQGLDLVFNLQTLLVVAAAAVFGVFVGAVPGLTATMAVALLVPITFYMDSTPAIAAIVTTSAMAIFAGDIPGTYLNIPGTPASAAYVGESHLLARQGRARETLGTNLVCSIFGGLFGTLVLVFISPTLAEVALNFSSYEYFWLALLGLSSSIFIAIGSKTKAFLSLMFGLLLSTVGLDMMSGTPRFTFGIPDLMAGINFIPVMIGMFALNEIMSFYGSRNEERRVRVKGSDAVFGRAPGHLRRYWRNLLRGSTLGTLIGALPGAGADIAAWISYALGKSRSKQKEKYGTGHIEGIVDASSANNSGISGAWVPALVFGIPGDSITAIVIGVLYMKGMNPGPTIFMEGGGLVYALFIVFFVANLIMLPIGFLAIRCSKVFILTPRKVLMPIILCFCIVGAFAINNTIIDVWLMLLVGMVAFVLARCDFPMAPAILGLVLGSTLENSFMSSMLKSGGDLLSFVSRPISASLGALVILIWLTPLLTKAYRKWCPIRKDTAARPS